MPGRLVGDGTGSGLALSTDLVNSGERDEGQDAVACVGFLRRMCG